jgi:hypothetical protein
LAADGGGSLTHGALRPKTARLHVESLYYIIMLPHSEVAIEGKRMPKKHKRWYDKDVQLAKLLDKLMKVHPKDEYRVVSGLLDLVRGSNPEILNRFTVPSDIDAWHRRWYDKDPIYWLVLNGLKFADEALLKTVADYLEKELGSG